MQPRILILSASSGNGHVKAGDALAKAFSAASPTATVEHIDALTLVSPAMRTVYSKAYIRMVNRAPSVLGWLYNHLDTPYKDERRRLLVNQVNSLPLIKKIIDFKPDLVVCTHFLPADIVSLLLAQRRIHARHAVVVTDFDAHGMWLTRNVHQYFVALQETKEHLVMLGVPRSKITVSGIPIDPAFAAQHRHSLEIANAKTSSTPTVLVSAGGLGVGPVEELVGALAQSDTPLHVIALCGKNTELKNKLDEIYNNSKRGYESGKNTDKPDVTAVIKSDKPDATTASKMHLQAVGYIDNMQSYMQDADIIVGKPGGLTTAEALACGLAFVVVNPIPGQEERNAAHLLEAGAAIRCNNMTTIAYKLNKLLNDPDRIATLQSNARAMGRPEAAKTVADHLLDGLAQTAPTPPAPPKDVARFPRRPDRLSRFLLPYSSRAL